MKRNLLVVTLCFLLAAAFGSAPSTASTPPAWSPSTLPSVAADEMRALFGTQVSTPFTDLNWSRRTTVTELGKAYPYAQPWIYYALPPCSQQITIGCIDSVAYQVKKGGWKLATLSSRQLPNRNGESADGGRNSAGVITRTEFNEWPANIENHEPAGGRASLWVFEGAPHGGGNEYLLRANISGINSAQPKPGNKVQRYLEMGLFPVAGNTEYQFPDDVEIKVRMKLGAISQDLWGWFDGRVIDPEVILDVVTSDGVFEVAGAPSRTPMGITPTKKLSEVGNEIASIFACPAGLPESMCPSRGGLKWISTDGNSPLSYFATFERGLGEATTAGYKTEWSIKSTRWPEVSTVSGCPTPQNGFTGIVTTNASMYETNAPRWNPVDKSFEFQVASPHLGLDAKANQGFYTLILPLTNAECRWGKDVNQAKAVISVLSSDGQTNVGVTNFAVKGNLLKFFVGGFTYSSPTIKIQMKAKEVVATKSPEPKSIASVQKSITCVKGKISKKVSGTNPVCPKGYKKK